jgi:sulfur carrier protein
LTGAGPLRQRLVSKCCSRGTRLSQRYLAWQRGIVAARVGGAIIHDMQVTLNGTRHDFDPPPASVADLVHALNLDGKRIAVEMNGEIVPKSLYAKTVVIEGDRLEVVAAVGGG